MLFDNWVQSEDIAGANKQAREAAVYDKNNIIDVLEDLKQERQREIKREIRKEKRLK